MCGSCLVQRSVTKVGMQQSSCITHADHLHPLRQVQLQ